MNKQSHYNKPLNNLIRALLGYAAQRDLSPEYICRLAGIDFARISSGQPVEISDKQFNDCWINAATLLKDHCFGLHFGESLQLAALGIVGQIIQSSTTVGEALSQAASLVGLLTDLFAMEVELGKTKVKVRLLPDPVKAGRYPATFRHLVDMCLVFTLHELDGLLLKKIRPETIRMPFKEVADKEEYYRLLRTQHITNSIDYLLVFPGEIAGLPVITADYGLQRILLEKLERESAAKGNSLRRKIEQHLKANAYLGIPSLEEIAANFNSSPRSLQRKLQDEGVTYQQLASACRMSLAVHYLESGTHAIKEISYMLGYNDMSSFSKAFKKWTGKAPVHFQKN